MKVESLDDLFDDDPKEKKEEKLNEIKNTEKSGEPKTLDLNSFDDAPILPQDPIEDDDTYDLQKELEAKFDELFGPLNED